MPRLNRIGSVERLVKALRESDLEYLTNVDAFWDVREVLTTGQFSYDPLDRILNGFAAMIEGVMKRE